MQNIPYYIEIIRQFSTGADNYAL
ncbi:uncharacterized protein METZ01_LOCUS435067, partial [marine metagenome]